MGCYAIYQGGDEAAQDDGDQLEPDSNIHQDKNAVAHDKIAVEEKDDKNCEGENEVIECEAYLWKAEISGHNDVSYHHYVAGAGLKIEKNALLLPVPM